MSTTTTTTETQEEAEARAQARVDAIQARKAALFDARLEDYTLRAWEYGEDHATAWALQLWSAATVAKLRDAFHTNEGRN